MKKLITHSKEILEQALESYSPLGVASSFGKDSMVLLHLAKTIKPDIQVFSVMTRFKPLETLAFKEYVTSIWDLNIKTYCSNRVIPDNLHKTDPNSCCQILKVLPTKAAISDLQLQAWVAGLRRDEGRTRHNFDYFEEYEENIVKVNPILDWTEADVWKYHAIHSIPVHPLYMKGYRSLGCAPCSLPYTVEERGGRWKGTDKEGGECGIHTAMYERKKNEDSVE